MPTFSEASTSRHTAAIFCSICDVGSTYAISFLLDWISGIGKFLRSTFPFAVRGRLSNTIMVDGTIYSGSFSFRKLRKSVVVAMLVVPCFPGCNVATFSVSPGRNDQPVAMLGSTRPQSKLWRRTWLSPRAKLLDRLSIVPLDFPALGAMEGG